MPIYEYELVEGECQMCPGRFEVLQDLGDDPVKHCPGCGLACVKVVSSASFAFKRTADPEMAARRGFTTWKKAKKGQWEKVAGPGVDVIIGTEEDIKAVEED